MIKFFIKNVNEEVELVNVKEAVKLESETEVL